MLFHYLFHTSLPLEGDDREIDLREKNSVCAIFFFFYQTGIFFCFLLFYNIFYRRAANFPSLYSTFMPLFPYLTRQTDRYLRGIYSSSRTQLLSTPRSKSHIFHFTHRSLPLRPSLQGSARPLSEVETLFELSTQELSVFLFFGFPGYCWAYNFFSNNFALE